MISGSAAGAWSSEPFLRAASPEPLSLSLPLPTVDVLTLFRRLTDGSTPAALLESGSAPSRLARYSFIAHDPYQTFSATGETYEVRTRGKTRCGLGDPVAEFSALIATDAENAYARPPGLPTFFGGAIGYLSYDVARQFECLPNLAKADLPVPDMFFMFVEVCAAIDHLTDRLYLLFAPEPARWAGESRDALLREGRERLRECQARVTEALPEDDDLREPAPRPAVYSEQSRKDYVQRVEACQELIGAGDIYQANISHRFRVETPHAAFGHRRALGEYWYRQVRAVNPSPFAALFVLEDCTLVSNSPERLVCVAGDCAEIRPIAGTRPRGETTAQDRRLVEELLGSAKERAEHVMLVDLARNDLGRVCRYGSVLVDEFMIVERYSHVSHLVSNVRGLMPDHTTACDVVRAVFPGGTITGVPKVHCMEIIERLEPVRRGPYTGSLGYFCWSGDMDLNILIRTLLLVDDWGYLQVGAGIVADSIPSREYDETVYKAQAFFDAFR